MNNNLMNAFISGFMDYMFILVFCLLGAIVKDTYNTISEKEAKVRVGRILISTLVSSIILFSLSDYIISKISWKMFILPCFIGGGLGFELFGKINKLSFWLDVATKKGKLLDSVTQELKEEDEKLNKEDEEKPK